MGVITDVNYLYWGCMYCGCQTAHVSAHVVSVPSRCVSRLMVDGERRVAVKQSAAVSALAELLVSVVSAALEV